MTCEHPGCSFDIFSSCTNHCMQNVCLEHLIEHGDIFLRDFTDLLDHLNKSTCTLMKEANNAAVQIIQRREYEIERINRMYNEEQQEIRKRLIFAEAANALLKDKQHKLINCKQQNECQIAQHDFEQIKSYLMQLKDTSVFEKQNKKEKPIINFEMDHDSDFTLNNSSQTTYPCPLIRPNVFGIKLEHNIRFDCDGSRFRKTNLIKHFESYHRMIPECAIRLKNAIVNGQSSDQTNLFSDNEIIFNQEFLIDCPLTDSTNVFGARSSLNTLMHIPCSKKQIGLPSMINHFHLYHRMKYDVAKKILHAIKNKSLNSNLILFEENERIGTTLTKKK